MPSVPSVRKYRKAKNKALSNGMLFHLAAILWRGKKCVNVYVNIRKTHPIAVRKYSNGHIAYHMHAEMNAIRFAKSGDILEVIRFKKDGSFAMAKPCMYCQKLIRSVNIFKEVRYTNHNGEWETLIQ
jgi:deoxycytidylate deaminase